MLLNIHIHDILLSRLLLDLWEQAGFLHTTVEFSELVYGYREGKKKTVRRLLLLGCRIVFVK